MSEVIGFAAPLALALFVIRGYVFIFKEELDNWCNDAED